VQDLSRTLPIIMAALNDPVAAGPTVTAAPPDQTQLLQTMARDLANMERSIEELRANQQQTASETSKAIEALKATPGGDKTRAGAGFRAEPAQDVIAADAADSSLAQARAATSAALRESAAANSKGMDRRRRMVAVDALAVLRLTASSNLRVALPADRRR